MDRGPDRFPDLQIHLPGRRSSRKLARQSARKIVKKVRVVLAEMPTMMTELIEQILAPYPELQIAGRVPAGHDVAAAARRHRADVLIVVRPGGTAAEAEVEQLFSRHPAKVIAITEGGREGKVYVLRPQRSTFGELSADSLAAAVRAEGIPDVRHGRQRRHGR
jgi:chemotaxis response regulator CheB